MKKILTISFFLIFTSSCTTIKQLINQKITSKTACTDNKFEQKVIFYKAKIDGVEENLILDTGATMSVITDSSAIAGIQNKKMGNFGSATGADNKSIDLKTFTAKFESDLFYSDNKVFAFVPKLYTKCQTKEAFKGILGLEVFFNNESSLLLDFTNKKICNIDYKEENNLIKNGYNQIKSICKSNQIFVFMEIEGKEYQLKFDTGFTGSLGIPFSKELNFSKFNNITLVGNLFRTIASNTDGEEDFYENVPLKMANETINFKLQVSKTLKVKVLGIQIIKGFDWIIDFKNNKVFFRKNDYQIENLFNKKLFNYLSSEKDNKLIIYCKQKNLIKYNLGDQITSVNSQKVTPDNICEMQNLLNNTLDWDTVQIEVIPVLK